MCPLFLHWSSSLVKSELDSLRKALHRENKYLVTELADLRSKAPTTPPASSVSSYIIFLWVTLQWTWLFFSKHEDKDFDGHSAISSGSDMNSLRPGVRQRRAERVRRSRLVYDLKDVSIITVMFLGFYVKILQAYVHIERFPSFSRMLNPCSYWTSRRHQILNYPHHHQRKWWLERAPCLTRLKYCNLCENQTIAL